MPDIESFIITTRNQEAPTNGARRKKKSKDKEELDLDMDEMSLIKKTGTKSRPKMNDESKTSESFSPQPTNGYSRKAFKDVKIIYPHKKHQVSYLN